MSPNSIYLIFTLLKAVIITGGLFWLFKRVLQPGKLYGREWYVLKTVGWIILVYLVVWGMEFVVRLIC